MKPLVPIDVDDATGVWSVDDVPMILVPRHFLLNNHLAIESALGLQKYSELLFEAGHRSAYVWCEKEAATHGLKGVEIFHHYMKRLSQRGWGQFRVESVDPRTGRARIQVHHSVFAVERKNTKTCYMFRGWFPGALEYVGAMLGKRLKLTASEIQCASEGHELHCIFEVVATAGGAPRRH